MIFWLALFTKVLFWHLFWVLCDLHAVVVLPGCAAITANHGTFSIVLVLDHTTNASDESIFFIISWGSSFCRGLLLCFAALCSTLGGGSLEFFVFFVVLTFGGTT